MSLEYAILGYLNNCPSSGYDLKRALDKAIRHFWPADQSQIYKSLARLAENALATVEVVPQDGRPNRKVYHITEAGRAALLSWLSSPPDSEEIRQPFLIQVFFSGLLSDEEVISVLEAKAKELRRTLDSCTNINEVIPHSEEDGTTPREMFFRVLTLESGLWAAHARLTWLEQAIDRIRKKDHEAGPHVLLPPNGPRRTPV